MKIEYAWQILAQEGDGFTDIIELSPPRRSSDSEAVKLRGSRGVFRRENFNVEYEIAAKIPYFCGSYAAAWSKLSRLAAFCDALEGGDLQITSDDEKQPSVYLKHCTLSATFPDEIRGAFFEVSYEFRGAFFEAYAARVVPLFGGVAPTVGGAAVQISI